MIRTIDLLRRWMLHPPLSSPSVTTLILLMLGLLTRLAAIPMIVDMIVAILSTKIPMLLGTSPLPLPPVPPMSGFWAVLHEVRSEYAQILGTIYLLIAGPGRH